MKTRRTITMAFRTCDIIATLIFHLIHFSFAADHILSCNVSVLNVCPGRNQICNGSTSKCDCLEGYVFIGDECGIPEPASGGSATVPVLLTITTLALLIGALILVVRKYNLLEYIRQKINLRRNNDMMYEDVMIGQDDPPLSP